MFALQAPMQCSCGNSYEKHGPSDEKDCYKPCVGNSKEICGGHWRNSVYVIDEGNIHCVLVTIDRYILFLTKLIKSPQQASSPKITGLFGSRPKLGGSVYRNNILWGPSRIGKQFQK